MDYSNTDPMFGSAVFQEVMASSLPHSLHAHQNMTVLDFDSYSRPTMLEANDLSMGVDSPTSESYCESDDATSLLGFQDSVTSPEAMEDDAASSSSKSSSQSSLSSSSQSQNQYESFMEDDKYNADRNLVMDRWGPHNVFPADKSWSLEQKATKLIQLSPSCKYSVNDLMNLDSLEKAEDRVNILIEIVAGIKVTFRWNFVRPQELFKSYTVVTNCKKEKEKKDADGNTIPKRPMNAFMIWCQKCRTLMAHICPQLHNAIISKALGAAWKKFTPEERGVYEDEKIKLMAFHQNEFPDYKYRPKKKPKKSEEKSSPVPKQKSSKKNGKTAAAGSSSSSSTPGFKSSSSSAMLRGINIADEARVGLDPLLKERLQVKMQVKIDSDLKRGIGKRATAIDFADLTGFQTTTDFSAIPSSSMSTMSSSSATSSLSLTLSPPDSGYSSVFDTPENSPHDPREPRTPTEIVDHSHHNSNAGIDHSHNTHSNNGSIIVTTGSNSHMAFPTPITSMSTSTAFSFDDKMAIHLQLDNNGNSTIANNNNTSTIPNNNILPMLGHSFIETTSTTSTPPPPTIVTHIKTEPVSAAPSPSPSPDLASASTSTMWSTMPEIKQEPMDFQHHQAIWANNNVIKPEVKQEPMSSGMPVLSVEMVESVLQGQLFVESTPDMNELMTFISTPTQELLNETTSQFIIDNTAPIMATIAI